MGDSPSYGISLGQFSGNIYAGRLNKAENEFISKSDQTMAALLAVSELVVRDHDGELTLTAPGQTGYRLTVERIS